MAAVLPLDYYAEPDVRRSLAQLAKGETGRVVGITTIGTTSGTTNGTAHRADVPADLVRRLSDLGFLPGEPVRVLARALSGEPIAVRIGTATYALRRQEADCILIAPLE